MGDEVGVVETVVVDGGVVEDETGVVVVLDAGVVLELGSDPPGVRLLKPNQSSVSVSCSGTVWPTPCARMAWTLDPKLARLYPDWGLLVMLEEGVCDTPKTLVHCLISSQKF